MKKFRIIFLLSFIIIVTAFGCAPSTATAVATGEYLRIHIRADSNDEQAQAVKYAVRDEIVCFLTPLVAEYQTQAEAVEGVRLQLSAIARVAENALEKNGYFYGANARLNKEVFPTRIYGEYTLPAGEYYALIVELGRGAGDNWWCVVYPPLCFASPSGGQIVYKSKIAEIIQKWKNG